MPRLESEQPRRQELVDYMTAADLIGVSPGVLLRWLREGEFPGERLKVKWHVTSTDIANELGTTPAELERNTNLDNKGP
jgi:predicted site-specific integrase-resolvase